MVWPEQLVLDFQTFLVLPPPSVVFAHVMVSLKENRHILGGPVADSRHPCDYGLSRLKSVNGGSHG
jgi:hypothetical protein